jgi:hypothetical protein
MAWFFGCMEKTNAIVDHVYSSIFDFIAELNPKLWTFVCIPHPFCDMGQRTMVSIPGKYFNFTARFDMCPFRHILFVFDPINIWR